MAEYGILYLLTRRALEGSGARSAGPGAALFAVFYAVSDEIHQGFVPGRTGCWQDVAIDAAGIFLAYAGRAAKRLRQ